MSDNESASEPSIVNIATYREFGYLLVDARDEFGEQRTYYFKPLTDDYADNVRGLSTLDIDNTTAVVPVSDNAVGNNYHPSYDDKPEPVIQAVVDAGYTVVGNVDAGWSNWDGRPEWSDSYADFSNAQIIAAPDQSTERPQTTTQGTDIDIWVDVQFNSEGISITAYSDRDGRAVVEDEAWLTVSEIEIARRENFDL